jgi:hypothetical protein
VRRDGFRCTKLIFDILTVFSAPPAAIPDDEPLPHAVAADEPMDFDAGSGTSGALDFDLPT